MIQLWATVFGIAAFLDWLTTQLIINNPIITEANPIMNLVVYNPVLFFVVKMGGTAIALFCMMQIDNAIKNYDVPLWAEVLGTAIVFGVATMYVYIVYNNVALMMLIGGI